MIKLPTLDDRTYASFFDEARALIPSLAPGWTDHNPTDPGIILVELFAWLAEIVSYRIDRVPERSMRTFLRLLRGAEPTAPDGTPLAIDDAIRTTIRELRERYRAITPDDFEHLALERWPTLDGVSELGIPGLVRRAKCFAEQSPATLVNPPNVAESHVTLVIVPDSLAASRSDLAAFEASRRFALELDGAASCVTCGNDASLAITGALTVSAWIFPRKQPTARWGIVSKSASGELELVLEPGGSLAFIHADGTDGGSVNAGVPVGRWSHVAAVRDAAAGLVSIFLDGKLVGDPLPLANKQGKVSNEPVVIGRRSNGTGFFNGFIRDVCIWNRIRSETELGGDMRRPPLGIDDVPKDSPLPRPVACWRLDTDTTVGGVIQPTPDAETPAASTQRPRDGTLVSATWRNVVRPLEPSDTLIKLDANQRNTSKFFAFLDEWRLVTTRLDVIAYRPLPVTIAADVYLRDDGVATNVNRAALLALERYLDPLRGGTGAGWPFGRAVYTSDLAAVFDMLAGVDFVQNVTIELADSADRTDPKRPPAQVGDDGTPNGVALHPHELPIVTGTALQFFQRVGTRWQTA